MTQVNYLTFRVGGQWYGVEVIDVIEVLHLIALDELPLASPDVLGLMTLRDRVMPVIDLRRRFHLNEAPLTLQTPILAVNTVNGALGLVVDDVDDVVPGEAITDYGSHASDHVRAVIRQGDRLLMVIDAARLAADAPTTPT